MLDCNVSLKRDSFPHFFGLFLLFALTGCTWDTIAPSGPEQPLPSVLCDPFIRSGYTQKLSFYSGEKMQVFFECTQPVVLCRLNIFSITGSLVFSTTSALPIVPLLSVDASENGYNYPIAVEFPVPALKSGVYLIENKIPFIIKTNQPVDVMIVYPSNTTNAYAVSGGKSLYSQQQRPTSVSFHRPIPLQSLSQFCLKWFTTLGGMTLGYVADVDLDNFENIDQAKVLVISGHSEYWTRQARQNFDRFVNAGKDALILSGNTMWWQVRYSEDLSRLICYKESPDPITDPMLKCINWNDPSLEYSILSSIGSHFPNGGYGLRSDQGWNGYKIVASQSPLFENSGLVKGDTIILPSWEYDGAPISGFDSDGHPIIDQAALKFAQVELIGYDKGFRGTETIGTFIVFKKSLTSGTVINTGTTDWCSANGMGGQSGKVIKQITFNALTKLLNKESVFSP